jgi:hypothetical protein
MVFDVRLVALLAHPFLPLLFGFALADRLARSTPASDPSTCPDSCAPEPGRLCQPNGVLNGLLDLSGFERIHGRARNSGTTDARRDPPRSPSARKRWCRPIAGARLGEVSAVRNAILQAKFRRLRASFSDTTFSSAE